MLLFQEFTSLNQSNIWCKSILLVPRYLSWHACMVQKNIEQSSWLVSLQTAYQMSTHPMYNLGLQGTARNKHKEHLIILHHFCSLCDTKKGHILFETWRTKRILFLPQIILNVGKMLICYYKAFRKLQILFKKMLIFTVYLLFLPSFIYLFWLKGRGRVNW